MLLLYREGKVNVAVALSPTLLVLALTVVVSAGGLDGQIIHLKGIAAAFHGGIESVKEFRAGLSALHLLSY